MSCILCIETTSTNCSVALARVDGGYQNSYSINHCLDLLENNSDQYLHGEQLHVFIDDILKRNELTPQDLAAVAISKGPGSYTGLRIGVSSAKGLCYALDIPLIAIDTLTALSLQDLSETKFVIPFLDARRMEVYASVFENGREVVGPNAVVLDESSFLRFRESGTTSFIGTGIRKFEELLPFSNDVNFTQALPTALTMCDMAIDQMKIGNTVDVAYFEPFYLKDFKVG
ncbi:MAG: tRNA (adenosine(37)-N6)-threonylcarbamoyltransferase complex dimerization subunit type 1 TsaB [Nonlabens sp.]